MANIADKISKLLALAESPYESEAKAALLKARQLMAEHKLRPEDFEKVKDQPVIRHLSGVFSTKLTTPWAFQLAANIAKHYCCRSYRSSQKGKKRSEVGFVGFAEDAQACSLAFSYAFDYVMKRYLAIKQEVNAPAPVVRQMCHSYGWGFCVGLEEAFEAQTTEHQDWGLVMVVPKAVEDNVATMKKGRAYSTPNRDTWSSRYAAMGQSDGRDFRLPGQSKQLDSPTQKAS